MTKSSAAQWSDLGALTTAGTVAATIFCCLPFATGVVGAALAAFGARLMPLQPVFVGLSLSSLAYSFYQAYRPGATCSADGCDVRLPVGGIPGSGPRCVPRTMTLARLSPLPRKHRRP